MLKFQDNHTMVIAAFEYFILTVYVVIDDLYRQFAPPKLLYRQHILDTKLSDPEIITIGICGELADINSENAWFSFVTKIITIFFQIFVAEAVSIISEEHFCRQRVCWKIPGRRYGKTGNLSYDPKTQGFFGLLQAFNKF